MTVLHRGSVLAVNGPELQQQQQDPIAKPIAAIGSEFSFLSFVSRENWIRQWCIRVISHVYFDRSIVFCIALNTIILAFADFSVVDDSLKPVTYGKAFHNGRVTDAYSPANHAIAIFDGIFAGIFTVEFVLKVVALGFTGKDSYWTNPWNVIDFLMLFASFVAEIPDMPNVSEFRAVRILRPLRSLSAFPGMKRLISALLNAIPALQSVVALQLFAFLIFGILGVHLFSGRMNHVCRLTEFPVRLPVENFSWPVSDDYLKEILENPPVFRCLDAPLVAVVDNVHTKETSPWNTPQHCFWPVNYHDKQLCAEPYHGGHSCRSSETCGSNYDAFGNPRFASNRVMQDPLHTVDQNWGYTTYDNIGRALLTIFQSVTEEGWTLIMYMSMDASYPAVGAFFAISLILFASYFVMNLTVAVISEAFKAEKPTMTRKVGAYEPSKRFRSSNSSSRPRSLLFNLVTHPIFTQMAMAMVFANTVVLSLDHYPMTQSMEMNLETSHFFFLCVFVTEMLLKLGGMGWKNYLNEKSNMFDAAIVISDLIEVGIRPPLLLLPRNEASGMGLVSLLRAFRLFRVFRLARRWKSLQNLLDMIARAVASIGNFGVLLFLFIYIFALVGMQFFANTMRFDEHGYSTPKTVQEFWNGTVPRSNFDTMPWAIATVFQIITGDNWSTVLYDAIRGNSMLASIYFIVLVILGDFVLMNLFLALLLDNFASTSSSGSSISENNEDNPFQETKRRSKISPIEASKQRIVRRMIMRCSSSAELQLQTGRRASAPPESLLTIQRSQSVLRLNSLTAEKLAAVQRMTPDDTENSPNVGGSKQLIAKTPATTQEKNKLIRGNSLFLLSPKHPLRLWVFELSTHPSFDSLILVVIIASSIVLAIENPLRDPDSMLAKTLSTLDKIFAVVFLFEMAIKILSLGFIMNSEAYFRNLWNIIDGLVAISSAILLFGHFSGTDSVVQTLLPLRDLRALRPLRMISRRPGLKLVVSALIKSMPAVANVVFLSMVLFLLFSIVAVHFLKGTFRACTGEVFDALSADQKEFLVSPAAWDFLSDTQKSWFSDTSCEYFPVDRLTSEYICGCWGASWESISAKHFDNVASAMLTFFILSTRENWSEIMKAACDATNPGMQPIVNHNELWIVFFIVFMIIGSFFVMNVFVGVVIDNFNTMKVQLGGEFLLTSEQKKWTEAQKSAKRIGPIWAVKAPIQLFRRFCFELVKNPYFEGFIMGLILLNTLLMAAHHFGESTLQLKVTTIVAEVSTGIFAMEAALKLTAYGRAFFNDNWNIFDLYVVVLTILGTIIQVILSNSAWTLTVVVRVVRVARVVRFVESSSSIRAILSTLYISLPGLTNITSILFLILFVYSTVGVHLFAKVGLTSNIDSYANFQTFGNGFLSLLRTATGESWDLLMYDYASSPIGCVHDPPYDSSMCGFRDEGGCVPLNGCGNPVAYIFFCSFTLIVAYVMLNLTVAVVLESFATSQEEEEESILVPELLEEFQYKWAELDPSATGFIRVHKMLSLVHAIAPPLGWFGVPLTMPQFLRYMCTLRLPLYEGEVVHFRDVILRMTREMINLTSNWALGLNSTGGYSNGKAGGTSRRKLIGFYAHEYFAARYLQRRVRQWLVIQRQFEKKKTKDFIQKSNRSSEMTSNLKKSQSEPRVLSTKLGPSDVNSHVLESVAYVEKFIQEEV